MRFSLLTAGFANSVFILVFLAFPAVAAAQPDLSCAAPPALPRVAINEATYFELPIRSLKQAVPTLRGIRYDASQDQLPFILNQVAKAIDGVLPRLPNLISREEVFHPQGAPEPVSAGGMAPEQPWSNEFNYLVLCHHGADGSTRIEELRTDSKGRKVDARSLLGSVRGYGFAYQWLFFSAANQPEFRFRYLGQQEKHGYRTFVIAFAQDPHRVDEPAYFMADGKEAPFYYQGILWVDQSTCNIVALRTDLLAPLPAIDLRRLTTELTFGSVSIRGLDAVFWLPNEVDITSDQGQGLIEENHHYSHYQLYRAEARVVNQP
jgi:hypothetical protein